MLIFMCTHTCHGYHHPPRAAITLHIRLAYPPSTSSPSAITHPSIFKQQSQLFLKSINISIFHACACPIWSPPPASTAHHLLGLLLAYLQPTTHHLIHPGCATCATHTNQPADLLPDFHGPVHYIATHSVWGLMPLLSLPLATWSLLQYAMAC